MNRRIAKIMDWPEHEVSRAISVLEAKNGYPSHDARLLADVTQKSRSKIASLGLDPDDTTAKELHHALLAKFEADSRRLDENVGSSNLNFDARAKKAKQVLAEAVELPQAWAIKNSPAKTILRHNPPRQLMKHLGYRSVESLLKRENLKSIFLSANFVESSAWQKNINRAASKLDQTALEPRVLEILSLNYDDWSSVSGPDNYVSLDENLLSIALWPSEETKDVPLISMLLLLAGSISEFENSDMTEQLHHIDSSLSWWADVDHLVAEINAEHVSFNLVDTAHNAMMANEFQDRKLTNGRTSFWQRLLSRYENLPGSDSFSDAAEQIMEIKPTLSQPEPAFEFVEDI